MFSVSCSVVAQTTTEKQVQNTQRIGVLSNKVDSLKKSYIIKDSLDSVTKRVKTELSTKEIEKQAQNKQRINTLLNKADKLEVISIIKDSLNKAQTNNNDLLTGKNLDTQTDKQQYINALLNKQNDIKTTASIKQINDPSLNTTKTSNVALTLNNKKTAKSRKQAL